MYFQINDNGFHTMWQMEVWWWLLEEAAYRNDPKFSDKYAWANSADPDQEQSDQGLHCLLFRLHRLDSLLYGRAT